MTATAIPRGTKAPKLEVVPPTRAPLGSLEELDVALIDVDDNVRDDVGELDELAASITEQGVLQPVKVTRQPDGRYRLVYGQRRLLACRKAGIATIPAVVDEPSDVDQVGARRSIEQLAENLQRKDLNALEEATALREVLDADPKLTQAELARRLGVSAPWVSNTLNLLEASPVMQRAVRAGQLTASHAKAVSGMPVKDQDELAKEAIERGFSAHGLESRVQDLRQQEEWQSKRAADNRQENEKRKTAAIASIEKKKLPKDARIHVSGWYSSTDAKPIAAALRKAGYTNVQETREGLADRARALDCDCVVWLVDLGYGGGASVKQMCVVKAHQDAKQKAEIAARNLDVQLQEAGTAALRRILAEDLVLPAQRRLAQVLLYDAIPWHGREDWAKRRHPQVKGKVDAWVEVQGLTDDELRAELAERVFAYPSGWPWDKVLELAGDAPKPAKGKKA